MCPPWSVRRLGTRGRLSVNVSKYTEHIGDSLALNQIFSFYFAEVPRNLAKLNRPFVYFTWERTPSWASVRSPQNCSRLILQLHTSAIAPTMKSETC